MRSSFVPPTTAAVAVTTRTQIAVAYRSPPSYIIIGWKALYQAGGDGSPPSPVFGFIQQGRGSLPSPVFGFIQQGGTALCRPPCLVLYRLSTVSCVRFYTAGGQRLSTVPCVRFCISQGDRQLFIVPCV